VICVCLTARRLLPLAPQISQVGDAAPVEREAITLPLDHAFGFELADVGPTAIKVQRQCRRADGRGLWAINGDGFGLRVRSCCVAVGYSDGSVSVKAVPLSAGYRDHAQTCPLAQRGRE